MEQAPTLASRTLNLADFDPQADGITDDTEAFQRCFAVANATAAECGDVAIVIPPGSYFLPGQVSIALASHTTVRAHGATFLLPQQLADGARLVLFRGRDLHDFHWQGGRFVGHCFDHRRPGNTWAPNANTRPILVQTSADGGTDLLSFTDLQGTRIAGAVVTVEGVKASESEVRTYATRVSLKGCRFEECGKFMWDYGLLWQILTWPEEYTPADVELARLHFHNELIHPVARMADGDDRIFLDNQRAGIRVSSSTHHNEAVNFLGDVLPANMVRGRQYFVVEATPTWIRIADHVGGRPVTFRGNGGPALQCLTTLHVAFYHLYAPIGAGPGKGAFDLVACRHVQVTDCVLSALGDTMHIQACRDVVFVNNQIVGSRMGAFFLAEHCVNATITGNIVDGTNGSRVMSVERSCTDVTIVGNTFRNGGRGSWINQPQGLVMANNIFVNNTTKGEPSPWRGRKHLITGGYGCWPELYFTTWQPGATYGPVVLQGNIFTTGPQCQDAVEFAGGGRDLIVANNVFQGTVCSMSVAPDCAMPAGLDSNVGLGKVHTGVAVKVG